MPSSLVWTIGLCPLLRLGGTLEPVEVVIPEVLQVVAQLIEGLAARAVEPTRPLPALMQQIGVLEHAQVLRDGRPTDVEVRGDLSGAQLIVGDKLEDAAAAAVGDGGQSCVHDPYVMD